MNTFDQPARSRTEQKLATSARVLAAARDEFEALGFERASVRGIAARAEVSAGTVLHHYGDKRQLLYAALHAALAEGLKTSLARMGTGSLHDRLMRLATGVFAVYEARPALSRTLLKEALFADGDWGARFVHQVADTHAGVCGAVREAVEDGTLAPEVDVDAVGLAFIAFFDFSLLAWTQKAPLPRGPMGLMDRLLRAHLDPWAKDRGGLAVPRPARTAAPPRSTPKPKPIPRSKPKRRSR